MLHKNVGKNMGEGGTHGRSLDLLIVDSIKIEKGGGELNFDKVEGFKVH